MTDPQPKYITTAEVCDQLGVDKSTVSRWVAAGRLKVALRGNGPTGGMFFDADEVAQLADQAEQSADATS
jgi:excisionase family DNA binding protein